MAAATKVKNVINDFLKILDGKSQGHAKDIDKLQAILNHLALIVHDLDAPFNDSEDIEDPPPIDRDKLRKKICSRYAHFGLYQMPLEVEPQGGEPQMGTMDAIEDIEDISADLQGILWRFENTSDADALSHLQFEYRSHWEHHLRSLQYYLHEMRQKL